MSDKMWVVKTPSGVFVEYDEPTLTYSDECTITTYVKEERLIRAEARIKVLEEALEHFAKLDIQEDKIRYQCDVDAENIRYARAALRGE